jgi:glycosyltransferase involved in cell wall biosynthesis
MPVYNGAPHIDEALGSVLAQDYPNLRVLVSDDCSTDGSVELVREHISRDPRIEVIVQPQNSGWAANMNSLISAVQTPYFFIMPQDDVIASRYVTALVERLEERPGAVLAASRMDRFGDVERSARSGRPSLRGTLAQRMAGFLRGWRAEALRGVVARHRLTETVLLPGRPAADILWLLALARHGDLERVDEPLYRKRIHSASATKRPRRRDGRHSTWTNGWTRHTVDCARIALEDITDPGDIALIRAAALDRLFFRTNRRGTPQWVRNLPPAKHRAMVIDLARAIGWDEAEALGAMGTVPSSRTPWQRALYGARQALARPSR